MKHVVLSFLLLYTTLYSDEIERIESIVNDIKELRSSYTRAKNEIVDYKIEIENLKKENVYLKKSTNSIVNNNKYTLRIASLENKIDELEVLLKNQKKSKKTCKLKIKKNQFPKLEMKEKYKFKSFKAKVFKLNKYAFIYDSIGGEVVESWEEKRSFTSNIKSENWIKITGYFEEKVWRASTQELWIKNEDVVIKELDKS